MWCSRTQIERLTGVACGAEVNLLESLISDFLIRTISNYLKLIICENPNWRALGTGV